MLKQLTTDDGLSEMQCFDIFQDSQGYIWIGTSTGANKYDGKDVVKFDRSNGLLSDHIYSFHEDSQQRIWVSNLNGEPIYIKDNIVHNRLTDPKLEKLKGNSYFIGWLEDKFNRIWFAHEEGYINIFDQDTIFRIEVWENLDIKKRMLHGMFLYNNEIILASTSNIKSIDPKSFETNWTAPIKTINSFLRKILLKDKLYLFNLFEAFVFDLTTKEFKSIKRLDGNPPIYDCRALQGEIFISTEQGISIVRDTIIEDYFLHPTIDSISITAIHEDMQGDIWFATRENGVFHYYNNDIQKSKYSKYCDINFMEKFSEDSLFIAQEDWTINLIVNDKLKWNKSLLKRGENKFNNVFLKDDELWITDKFKLHIDVGGEYRTFETYSREIYYDDVSRKYYWIGRNGFSIIDGIDKIFKYKDMHDLITADVDLYVFHKINNPYVFEVDEKQRFWVGSEEGLFCIRDKEIEKIDNPELNGSITDFKIKDGHLIGVNYGNGLFDFNINSRQITMLTREDGLPTNHFNLLDMYENNIWVSHATGICLLENDGNGIKLIKNFSREHGIPKGKITLLEIIDDVCHFVVNGNAYSIKPTQIVNDTIEVLMDTSAITYYTNESQTVTFDCINFTFADKIHYQYRLLPLDSVWKVTNGEEIDLEYIPSGEYQLEVRADHPLKLTNPIKRKPIHVQDRWYQESYFRWSLVFLGGFIIFFLIRIKAISFNIANFKHWIGEKIQKYIVKEQSNSFNIKDIHGVVHLLKINDVRFIKSSGNYLEFHTGEKKYVSRMTMSNAVNKFKLWTDIQRVHRSYMVNFKKIEAIDHKVLKVGNVDIPFTETYKDVIERKLEL